MIPSPQDLIENSTIEPNYIVILFVNLETVAHIVTFEEKPTDDDLGQLVEDIKTDVTLNHLKDLLPALKFATLTFDEYKMVYDMALTEAMKMPSGSIH